MRTGADMGELGADGFDARREGSSWDKERLWLALDEMALSVAEEPRRLAREAVAKHTLRPESFQDPREAPPSDAAHAALLNPNGYLMEAEEIDRILREFFARPHGVGAGPGADVGAERLAAERRFEAWLARQSRAAQREEPQDSLAGTPPGALGRVWAALGGALGRLWPLRGQKPPMGR